jgi:hypothetical protein
MAPINDAERQPRKAEDEGPALTGHNALAALLGLIALHPAPHQQAP